jgi:ribosomal protein L33
MAQATLIKLKAKSGTVLYSTRNKKKFADKNFKLKIKKYDPKLKKHVEFTEAKK